MEMMRHAIPRLSANQMRYINNWRTHFQVTTISDLCNAKGDSIQELYITKPTSSSNVYLHTGRSSKLTWNVQSRPSSIKTFQLWIKYIRKIILNRSGYKLRQPLGAWLVQPSNSISSWPHYMDSVRSTLYVRHQQEYMVLQNVSSTTPGTITFTTMHSTMCPQLPDQVLPFDVHTSEDLSSGIQYCVHHAPRLHLLLQAPTPIIQVADNIQSAIQQAPRWQQHLLQYFRIHDLDLLLTSLTNIDLKLFTVSDGGLKNQVGSFGVAVGTADQELYKIEGPVQGYREHLNSFRCEAYGMLANRNFLTVVMKIYQPIIPPNRKIHVYCDNLSLVRTMIKLRMQQVNPRIFLRSESDVLLQIAHEIKTLESLHFNVIIDRVKGHQDDYVPYHELSREAQLNVDADTYATNYMLIGDFPSYDILPANPANLYINQNITTRDVTNEIRKAAQSPELRVYMNRKFDWDDTIADLIWWSVHGSTILSFSAADRRRIRKFIFRWLPTCERLKKYNKELSDQCPSCNDCIETHRHLHQCVNTPRINIIEVWIESFEIFLSDERITPPIIRQLFLYHLHSIFTPSDPGIFPALTPEIQQAADDQDRIGWYHLLCGRLAFRWGTIIADYLDLNKICEKEMTALRWGRKFNRFVFSLTISIWKQRNNDGHTLTPLKESDLTRERLLLRIQALQDSNLDVTYHHRDFVFRPISIIATYAIANLRSWLRAAENLIRMNKRRRPVHSDISQFCIPIPVATRN